MNTTETERGLGNVGPGKLSDFDRKLRALIQGSPLFEGALSLEQFILRLMMTPMRLSLEAARGIPGSNPEIAARGVAHLLTVALNASIVAAEGYEILKDAKRKAH